MQVQKIPASFQLVLTALFWLPACWKSHHTVQESPCRTPPFLVTITTNTQGAQWKDSRSREARVKQEDSRVNSASKLPSHLEQVFLSPRVLRFLDDLATLPNADEPSFVSSVPTEAEPWTPAKTSRGSHSGAHFPWKELGKVALSPPGAVSDAWPGAMPARALGLSSWASPRNLCWG